MRKFRRFAHFRTLRFGPLLTLTIVMRIAGVLFSLALAWSLAGDSRKGNAHSKAQAPIYDARAVLDPENHPDLMQGAAGSAVVRLAILLDRAHFSPGEIDGQYGDNLRTAVAGYQSAHNLPMTGFTDQATWQSLNAETIPVLVAYTIAPSDIAGPFDHIPQDMMAQARLKSLGYQSPEEGLGERFHISPKLLTDLNPNKDLRKAGEEILVPNVQRQQTTTAEKVIVSKGSGTVTAFAADATLLAQYPATMGSEHDPLPLGSWKVTTIQQNPIFHYNPNLFWDAKSKDTKADIAPGPNNPVGVVWIGLSKEHYGIHGTPEPSKIGHAESHGCIRLTNWDAEELSKMVRPGTSVILQE